MSRLTGDLPFGVAVERLARLPERLPPPPDTLMPVRLDAAAGGGRQPAEAVAVRPAAVLVLIVPGPDGEARIVLTERVAYDGHHSGEVSFPGGKTEPGDADAVATALREAREEVALDPVAAGVRILGVLEPFWIPISGFHVTPVLGIARRLPLLRPNEAEVARVVLVPAAAFLPDAPIVIVERTIRDWSIRYGAYEVDGLHVWGATARILGQLGAVLDGTRDRAN